MNVPDGFACAAELGGVLAHRLGGLDDPEGERVPDDLPPVIDAHVHCFPDPVFEALWRWFDTHAWPVRYRLHSESVLDFLLGRGVDHVVVLHYAHAAGMAGALNAYVADLVRDRPRVTGLATVLPGEPDAYDILADGFSRGLAGVKLHCHVQCFAPDDEAMVPVYEACVDHDRPLVVHAGREPKSPAYRCDPYALCAVDRIERVLRRWPDLRLCVPHLGADEFEGYADLMCRYDHLWLDTTMLMADYFPMRPPVDILARRPERVMYGTDFPNLPFSWDRELRQLQRSGLSDADLERVLGGNARELFRIGAQAGRS